MSDDPARSDRFPRDGWFLASTPGASGKFTGAIIAILGIAPFLAGTFLERALGDLVAILVLGAAGAGALAGAILLVIRRYRVLAAFLGALAVGCAIAIWVTAAMDW